MLIVSNTGHLHHYFTSSDKAVMTREKSQVHFSRGSGRASKRPFAAPPGPTLGGYEGVLVAVAVDKVGVDVRRVLVVPPPGQGHPAVVVAEHVRVPVLALVRLQPADKGKRGRRNGAG